MRYQISAVCVSACAVALLSSIVHPCRADVPRTIPFLGKLLGTAGNPLPDGPQTVTFRLHSGAAGTFSVADELHTFTGPSITLQSRPVVEKSDVVIKADGTATFARGAAYTIDYQTGVITRVSAVAIPDGTQVKVSYQHTAALLWEETKPVTVVGGFFTTSLGDTIPLPASFDQAVFLGIQAGSDPEMTPRMPLQSAPHALSVADSTVSSAKLTSDPASLAKVSGGVLTSKEGRLGLGTADPQNDLDITGSGSGLALNVGIRLAPSGQSPATLSQNLDGTFMLTNGGEPRLTVTSAGTVGIGTTTPSTPLHVVGPDSNGAAAPLKITSGAQNLLLDGNEIDASQSPLAINGNVTGDITLANGGGNVGIGTNFPSGKLEVRDSQTLLRLTSFNTGGLGSLLQFQNVGAGMTANAQIDFLDPAGSPRGRIAFDASENLTFRSGGSDRMRLDATGKLSLGTTSARALLTLRGPDDINDGPSITLTGTASDQSESGRIRFVEGTASANWRGAYMHFDGAANRFNVGVHATSDADPANDVNAVSITRSAAPLVGIGTESPGAKLDVNGDIRANGTVSKTYGGSTYYNFAPVAMAHIESNGTITTGTPNVSCTFTSSTKTYHITIAGENFITQAGRYITLVVPGNVGNVSIPHIGPSGTGSWSVTMQDGLGSPHANRFSFVVYKP